MYCVDSDALKIYYGVQWQIVTIMLVRCWLLYW